jgi:broad specificity phosphatase PhoE
LERCFEVYSYYGQIIRRRLGEIEATKVPLALFRPAPQGRVRPKGESYAILADLLESGLGTSSRDSAIVSHGGVAGVLLVLRTGMPSNQAADAKIGQGKHLPFKGDTLEWI